jgi:hypothetical protein
LNLNRILRTARLFIAMSVDEAASILGVSSSATPEEIQKAYKAKVFENHPDRGGDPEKMVAVNVAKDVLDGKRSPSYAPSDSGYGYNAPKQPKPDPVRVSFEEAMGEANVPTGVDWKLVGAPAYGGYGDTSISGCVVYGQKGTQHIFVSLYHKQSKNAFTGEDLDTWTASVVDEPLSKPADKLVPAIFKRLYSEFEGTKKGFSGKVALANDLPKITEAIMWFKGRDMAIQDAIDQLGGATAPAAGKKLSVVMQLVSTGTGYPQEEGITIIINGREYPLEKRAADYVIKKTSILRTIFGAYFYFDSSKKDLTRAKKGKDVLRFLSEIVGFDNEELRDLLMAASDQMKA